MPAAAGAAMTDETPGTTSKSRPAADERERLLAAAAEHERIAALQAHDVAAAAAELDEQLVDQLLRHRCAGTLADVDQLGVGSGEREHAGADERVVHDDVGCLQPAQPADGQQLRVARAGADQRDHAATVIIIAPGGGVGRLVDEDQPAALAADLVRRRDDRLAERQPHHRQIVEPDLVGGDRLEGVQVVAILDRVDDGAADAGAVLEPVARALAQRLVDHPAHVARHQSRSTTPTPATSTSPRATSMLSASETVMAWPASATGMSRPNRWMPDTVLRATARQHGDRVADAQAAARQAAGEAAEVGALRPDDPLHVEACRRRRRRAEASNVSSQSSSGGPVVPRRPFRHRRRRCRRAGR